MATFINVYTLMAISTLLIGLTLTAPTTHENIQASTLEEIQSNLETATADKDVLDLEHLKTHSSHLGSHSESTLPNLEQQLQAVAESASNQPSAVIEDNRDDLVLDVESPVIHDKLTTITSQVKTEQHHEVGEKPDVPPFDEYSLNKHHDKSHELEEIHEEETHEEDEAAKEEKPTPKTYSGAARILGCTTCGSDHAAAAIVKEHIFPSDESTIPVSQKRFHVNGQKHTIQSAESLFRHSGGQYSANDLAQYIFWTGDETGVARAVEELIDRGMISREAALILLKDIRTELNTLQAMYAKDEMAARLAVKPPKQVFELNENYKPEEKLPASVSPQLMKMLASLPGILKLNKEQISNEDVKNELITHNGIDYDETTGRLRLADFLYAEYSLEEVIYQLAKVLFSQSLHQGSEKAQMALQKLTGFLESEGAHGRLSPALQKKVLDVLLVALSDTLNESPELMQVAKQALGDYLHKLPKASSMKIK